jgi:hypothetical protein
MLISIFAIVALLLAALGLYAVLSYIVVERTLYSVKPHPSINRPQPDQRRSAVRKQDQPRTRPLAGPLQTWLEFHCRVEPGAAAADRSANLIRGCEYQYRVAQSVLRFEIADP